MNIVGNERTQQHHARIRDPPPLGVFPRCLSEGGGRGKTLGQSKALSTFLSQNGQGCETLICCFVIVQFLGFIGSGLICFCSCLGTDVQSSRRNRPPPESTGRVVNSTPLRSVPNQQPAVRLTHPPTKWRW